MSGLEELLAELADVDARLNVEDRDFTINARGAEPLPEDHGLDGHAVAVDLAEERRGPERLHEKRQRLIEQIDRLRLG